MAYIEWDYTVITVWLRHKVGHYLAWFKRMGSICDELGETMRGVGIVFENCNFTPDIGEGVHLLMIKLKEFIKLFLI